MCAQQKLRSSCEELSGRGLGLMGQKVAGSRLTRGTVLCPWISLSTTLNHLLSTERRLYMTEKC